MIVDPAGQTAETVWRVRGRGEGIAWLELEPRTGRTHQIRVHCAHLGFPLVGDRQYGDPGDPEPMMLLARAIVLPLYPDKPPLRIEAPVPEHMRAALRACGRQE